MHMNKNPFRRMSDHIAFTYIVNPRHFWCQDDENFFFFLSQKKKKSTKITKLMPTTLS